MKQLPLGILLQLGIEGNLVSGDGLQVVLLREDAVGLMRLFYDTASGLSV